MTQYHLSMGYLWPSNPTANFNGTLAWGPVEIVNGEPTSSSTLNFDSLNSGDTFEFYVYDLANSGTSPVPASTWINPTPQDEDDTIFNIEDTMNSNVQLTSMGSLISKYFTTVASAPYAVTGAVP